ncbi:hypothetical protein P692DRAFT_20714539, partial [Suillus brevipes Sb2]
AEVKACEQAKKLQLLEVAPGTALSILQASIQRLVVEHWDVKVKRCKKAKWAQLLKVLLAAHSIFKLTWHIKLASIRDENLTY